MIRAAVLGAGYMGSAITFPLSQNGVQTNLWGTWLDDEIIDICSRGDHPRGGQHRGTHPRLRKTLPDSVSLYHSDKLYEAVNDVDMIIVGVSSEGFIPVFSRLIETIERPCPVFTLTKGFIARGNRAGSRVVKISTGAEEIFREKFKDQEFLWASVGGPVKAVELADEIPTATVFGTNHKLRKDILKVFSTDYYRVFTCGDVTGVELCSAFKNVYSIAVGICDGLFAHKPSDSFHNFRAFLFNRAVIEMAVIVEKAGGKRETVFNLAGMGDLHVTSSSGRNRKFGDFIGRGQKASDAFKEMLENDELAEGYDSLKHGKVYVDQLDGRLIKELPLLETLYKIVCLDRDADKEMRQFISLTGN
jgi:glycerol-3-phosphate dehydrogenase (NAD(P)+)